MTALVSLPSLAGLGAGSTDLIEATGQTTNLGALWNVVTKAQVVVPLALLAWYQGLRPADLGLDPRPLGRMVVDVLACLVGAAGAMGALWIATTMLGTTIDVGADPFGTLVRFGEYHRLPTLVLLVTSALATAACEEFVYRAYLYEALGAFVPSRWGRVPVFAMVFALGHVALGLGSALFALLFGLTMGVAYLMTRNLYALIVAHAVVDLVFLVLYS